jgi:hypothetical protein
MWPSLLSPPLPINSTATPLPRHTLSTECAYPWNILLLLPPRWAAVSRLLPVPPGELSVELELYMELELDQEQEQEQEPASKEQELDRGGWAGGAWSG